MSAASVSTCGFVMEGRVVDRVLLATAVLAQPRRRALRRRCIERNERRGPGELCARVGSLFSGIGGIDLGLERAGMEIVWQVENDDFCQRVLARHFPDAARFRDVRDCHGAEALAHAAGVQPRGQQPAGDHEAGLGCEAGACLAPVDLICGGFPCQPVSHAGKRQGDADERWLWPEFHRIVREVRPRYVLVENVPGLLSINDGRLFGGILADLADSGYDAEWDCIPAAALGAPHIRDRVFLIAYADRCGDAAGKQEHASARQPVRLGKDGLLADAERAQRRENATRRHDAHGHDAGRQEAAGGLEPSGEALANAGRSRLALREARQALDEFAATVGARQWTVEPDVGRVAHGIPARVDRLRGLGNAVVPQVAEYVGRMIMDAAAVGRAQGAP